MQAVIDKLVQRFQWIDRERMRGLPFYNDQLQVEAIDFEEIDIGYIGALITPWFINIILLFKQPPQQQVTVGQRCKHILPAGELEFMVGEDEVIGRYDFISLASPVRQFKTRQQAQVFAREKLRENLHPETGKQLEEHPLVFAEPIENRISRRVFLTGRNS
jgi:[NiFe] hydrogenase assembly HybE family chaperone